MPVDLMIVGAQKSGTTSLLAYLGDHPRIRAQHQREMTWFVDPQLHRSPFPEAFYFPGGHEADDRRRLGKLASLMYHEDAVDRLRAHNPAVHAIVILREPVARAYSSFWFNRARGREPIATFGEAITADRGRFANDRVDASCAYVEWGRYADYIETLQRKLGVESVHALVLEEFVEDPQGVLGPWLERIGLGSHDLPGTVPAENSAGAARSVHVARVRRRAAGVAAARRLLPGGIRAMLRHHYQQLNQKQFRPPPMDPMTKMKLKEIFSEPNERLEAMLGRRIEAWHDVDP